MLTLLGNIPLEHDVLVHGRGEDGLTRQASGSQEAWRRKASPSDSYRSRGGCLSDMRRGGEGGDTTGENAI